MVWRDYTGGLIEGLELGRKRKSHHVFSGNKLRVSHWEAGGGGGRGTVLLDVMEVDIAAIWRVRALTCANRD